MAGVILLTNLQSGDWTVAHFNGVALRQGAGITHMPGTGTEEKWGSSGLSPCVSLWFLTWSFRYGSFWEADLTWSLGAPQVCVLRHGWAGSDHLF